MNATVEEWIAKARADYGTAGRELRVTTDPNLDAACFHAQQSVEKLMKGLLIHVGVVPPKTHDLVQLDQLLRAARPDWSWPIEELRFLTRASLDFRYPGESADRDDAGRAFDIATRVRAKLTRLFEEPT